MVRASAQRQLLVSGMGLMKTLCARSVLHIGLLAMLLWFAAYFYIAQPSTRDPEFVYLLQLGTERAWSALFLTVANIGVFGLLTANRAVRLLGVLVVSTTVGVLAGCLVLRAQGPWSGIAIIISLMGYYLAYDYTREIVQARSHVRTGA